MTVHGFDWSSSRSARRTASCSALRDGATATDDASSSARMIVMDEEAFWFMVHTSAIRSPAERTRGIAGRVFDWALYGLLVVFYDCKAVIGRG